MAPVKVSGKKELVRSEKDEAQAIAHTQHDAGEIKDEIRQAEDEARLNGQAHQPY